MQLSVPEVYRLATRHGWEEIQFNTDSAVIGFRRGVERLNVYYTTGTVGTCTDHPRLGKTQLFRRNVSLALLEMLFIDIHHHTGLGYYYKKLQVGDPEPGEVGKSVNWWCTTDQEMKVLVDNDTSYDPAEYPIVVLGATFLAIHYSGRCSWGAGIPKDVDNMLRGRQLTLPTVDIVCLGPDDHTYFVQFADGEARWSGLNDELSRTIKETFPSLVKSIALGPDNAYFCLFDDGSSMWSDIPSKLHDLLNGRQKSLPPPEQVNLGPNGEWFVRF